MKNLHVKLLALLVLTFAGFPAFAADTYTFDPDHTSLLWHITHFGFSHPDGKFSGITGTLVLDETDPQKSQVNVSIPTDSIISGVAKLDEKLKSDEFFNVAKFPVATFTSNKVEVTGKTTAIVTGTLTLLGIAKPITLDVTLNKIGENPINKKKTAGFTATTTIKRSDFGMNAFIPALSDEVELEIQAETNLK